MLLCLRVAIGSVQLNVALKVGILSDFLHQRVLGVVLTRFALAHGHLLLRLLPFGVGVVVILGSLVLWGYTAVLLFLGGSYIGFVSQTGLLTFDLTHALLLLLVQHVFLTEQFFVAS